MLGYLAGLTGGGPVRSVLIDQIEPGSDRALGVFSRGTYHEVVNPNPRESELGRCAPEDFAARFDCVLEADEPEAPDDAAAVASATAEFRPDEIWHSTAFTCSWSRSRPTST